MYHARKEMNDDGFTVYGRREFPYEVAQALLQAS
jgi:hypothetical protein